MLDQLHIVGIVYAAVEVDNKLYLGGQFTSVLGQARSNFAVINLSDGSLDPFDAVFNSRILSIADIGNGRIILSGVFSSIQEVHLGPTSRATTGIVVLDCASGLFSFFNITAPVYPDPGNPYAGSFVNLAPRFGIVKYNPTTDTIYASLSAGGVSVPGGIQDQFGVISIDASTLEIIGSLNEGFQTVLFRTYGVGVPGYPWNTPTPLTIPGDGIAGMDIDISGQTIYVSPLKSSFDNSVNIGVNFITRYDISDRTQFASSSWEVTSSHAARIFFRTNKIFLAAIPSPQGWGPTSVQGTTVSGGAVISSADNPTSGSVSPFNPGFSGPTGASVGPPAFERTVWDMEEYDGKLFVYGKFGSLITATENPSGECVLALDETTYARLNSPANTSHWAKLGYQGPQFDVYTYGLAQTYFRHDNKIHVFGRFPQISGAVRSDPTQLILNQDADLPQNKFLVAL